MSYGKTNELVCWLILQPVLVYFKVLLRAEFATFCFGHLSACNELLQGPLPSLEVCGNCNHRTTQRLKAPSLCTLGFCTTMQVKRESEKAGHVCSSGPAHTYAPFRLTSLLSFRFRLRTRKQKVCHPERYSQIHYSQPSSPAFAALSRYASLKSTLSRHSALHSLPSVTPVASLLRCTQCMR